MFKLNRAQLIVASVITCLTIQQSYGHEVDSPNGPNARPAGTVSARSGDGSSSYSSTETSLTKEETSESESVAGAMAADAMKRKTKLKTNKKAVKSNGTLKPKVKQASASGTKKSKRKASTKIVKTTTKKTIQTSSKQVQSAPVVTAAVGTEQMSSNSMSTKNVSNTVNTTNTTNTINTINNKNQSDIDYALDKEIQNLDIVPMQGMNESTTTRTKTTEIVILEKNNDEPLPEINYVVPKKHEFQAVLLGSGMKSELSGSDNLSDLKASSTKYNSAMAVAYGFGQGTYVVIGSNYISDEGSVNRGSGYQTIKSTTNGFDDVAFLAGHKFIGENSALIIDAALLVSPENSKTSRDVVGNKDQNASSGRTTISPEVIGYLFNKSLLGGASVSYDLKQDGSRVDQTALGVKSDVQLSGGNRLVVSGFAEQREKLAIGGKLSYIYDESATETTGFLKRTIDSDDLVMGTAYLKYHPIKELQLIGGLSYGRVLNLNGLSVQDSNIFGLTMGGKLLF